MFPSHFFRLYDVNEKSKRKGDFSNNGEEKTVKNKTFQSIKKFAARLESETSHLSKLLQILFHMLELDFRFHFLLLMTATKRDFVQNKKYQESPNLSYLLHFYIIGD